MPLEKEFKSKDIWLVVKTVWKKNGEQERMEVYGRFDTEELAIAHAKKGTEWEANEFLVIHAKECYFDWAPPDPFNEVVPKGELPPPPVIS